VLIRELSLRQQVELICPEGWREQAHALLTHAGALAEQITWHPWPLNDAWCRDHGPLFVHNPSGGLEVVDVPFNAWGGKFTPWQHDDDIASRVSEQRKLPFHRVPVFGEGGALEVNATGVLMTTESVWLNPNRNPDLTREKAEEIFAEFLGITETVWLPDGMEHDDTDGHIDTLARFVEESHVVVPVAAAGDPDAAVLNRNRDLLRERFTVSELPHPPAKPSRQFPDRRLPRSYANFLLINDAVLVPIYAEPDSDGRTLGILRDLFPHREIVPVLCTHLVEEGGAVHCLTMQEPMAY